MRKALSIVFVILLIITVFVALPATRADLSALQVTLPGTNTPPSFNIATNTPAVTPSPTTTPTATFTATFTSTPSATPTATPSPTPTLNGPFIYPEGFNPLTGRQYTSAQALQRRTLIVKISNFPPEVRPQSGVNAADVVYEYETEGGVTRFAALFRENAPEHVGSVRSARLLDLELVQMYRALLAYSGTSEPIQALILAADWNFQALTPLRGDNCEEAGFCRFPREGLPFEHTLFLDTVKAWERADARGINTGFRAHGFAFSAIPDDGGRPANDVAVDYFGQIDVRWQFDEASGRYLRFTDNVPHFDAADGEQLWTDNLVIIEVQHNRRPDLFPPGSNFESLEIALWDQGRALLVRDGQVYGGFWRRRSTDPGDALQLIYGNNAPMMMKPGRTWVSVVRGLGNAEISEGRADVPATATTLALSATPTPTPFVTPGPTATFEP